MKNPNKNMHSGKIKLHRFAMQLYFAGDVKRWLTRSVSQRPVEERARLRNISLIVMSANNRFETDTLGRAPQPGVIFLKERAHSK